MPRGQFSSGAFAQGAINRGAIFLGGNYPRGLLYGGQQSRGQSSRGQLSKGQLSGGNFLRGEFSGHPKLHTIHSIKNSYAGTRKVRRSLNAISSEKMISQRNHCEVLGTEADSHICRIRLDKFNNSFKYAEAQFFSGDTHCVKSLRIRSFSAPYFPAFRLNMD